MLYGVTRIVLIIITAYINLCAILKISNVGKPSCGWEGDVLDGCCRFAPDTEVEGGSK